MASHLHVQVCRREKLHTSLRTFVPVRQSTRNELGESARATKRTPWNRCNRSSLALLGSRSCIVTVSIMSSTGVQFAGATPKSRTRISLRPAKRSTQAERWVYPKDCRELIPIIDTNSVSLIITDPPYFIDGMDDSWDRDTLIRRASRSKVVGSLPVGMKFDRKQGKRLQEFLRPIAEEWMRVLRPGGFALCFSQNRLVHRAAAALEDAGFEIRDILVWKYEGQAKAFGQDHFIRRRKISQKEKERLIAKLGGRKTPQMKPQCEMIVLAQAPRDGTFVDNWDRWETGLIDVRNPVVGPDRFPGTVIEVPKPRERHGHMTAKPVDLLRHLVRIFSAKGSLVFDPFAGSGSTGVAARMEERQFIGAEIDPKVAERANMRIKLQAT